MFKYSVANNFYSQSYKSNFLKIKYPTYVPNITALHNAQLAEYGSASTMVTIGKAESAPPPAKEDISKAVGIRVKLVLKAVLQ